MTAINSVISLFLILILVFYFHREYRVSKLRQDLFELRDSLFDEAINGNIKFSSKSYIATRLMINGMIRFSHNISFSRMVFHEIMLSPEDRLFVKQRFESKIEGSSKEDIELTKKYIQSANRLIVRHMVFSPPVLCTMLLPLLIFIAKEIIEEKMRFLDGAAHREGSSLLRAAS